MADCLCLCASDRGGCGSGSIPLRRGHGLGVSIGAIERHEKRHSFCVWLHRCGMGFVRNLGLVLLADA
jgi:hypothetical protein